MQINYIYYIFLTKKVRNSSKNKKREKVLKGRVSKAQIWSHHIFFFFKLASLKFEIWVNKKINRNEKK